MVITQSVTVPADHRLTIDVPADVPAGPTVVAFAFMSAGGKRTPETEKLKDRGYGCAKGQIWMADDFTAPLEDFKDYM